MLSHEDDDSDSDTGISSKFASSTEINVYVNPHENVKQAWGEEKEKEMVKHKDAHVKRSLFKNIKNQNTTF